MLFPLCSPLSMGLTFRMWEPLSDKLYVVRFKPPEISTQPVIASSVEIRDDHLILLDSKGELSALFLMEVVESWSESDL
jgi:hypothetical protein